MRFLVQNVSGAWCDLWQVARSIVGGALPGRRTGRDGVRSGPGDLRCWLKSWGCCAAHRGARPLPPGRGRFSVRLATDWVAWWAWPLWCDAGIWGCYAAHRSIVGAVLCRDGLRSSPQDFSPYLKSPGPLCGPSRRSFLGHAIHCGSRLSFTYHRPDFSSHLKSPGPLRGPSRHEAAPTWIACSRQITKSSERVLPPDHRPDNPSNALSNPTSASTSFCRRCCIHA